MRREKERAREKARREKEREKARREKEREKARREKEREKARREKEREKARREKERAREKARREKERERLKKQREKEKEKERRRREEERRRREEERERAREAARLAREKEREAYRKAKAAEREKLRAEKEAARRALEGRVSRLTKRAQRAQGVGRGSTTRVYRPDAIPNQSGTRRSGEAQQLTGVARPAAGDPLPPLRRTRPPPPPPPKVPAKIEDRYALIRERLGKCPEDFRRDYSESFDMSWIYHDSALEGVVYNFKELKTAIDPNITVVPDSSLQPVCEEIRRHKAALDLVRELGEKKRTPINLDIIKKLYLTLHPDHGDMKSVKYRKDVPQHRLYFHEYIQPDKIAYRMRQILDWLNGPDAKKMKAPLEVAAKTHYDILRVFPFSRDSGKVARLLMNVLLLRAGHPPAIIHSTERQRYYEALKGSLPTVNQMVRDAILNGMASIEKRLDDRESRTDSFNR